MTTMLSPALEPRTERIRGVAHVMTESSPARNGATICQVLHSLNVGGAEVLAGRLARRLSASFRFVFACLDELGPLGHELESAGFRVEVFERRPGVDLNCVRRLADFLRRERVTIVQAHQYTPFFYSLAARLIYRRPAVLFTEHGRFFPDYPRRKRIAANRLLLEKRDRVVAVGQAVRKALVDNEGICADRIAVIYNGVDLDAFATVAADRAATRTELGFARDDFLVLHVARLDEIKDHGTALRAIERVVGDCPNVRLAVVGDGPELEKIEREVRERRLESVVRLLGLRTDVARLLRASDLFLLTSVSEGIPLTIIEAMIAGLPVVSTGVGGVPEVVEDGSTGLLAPAGNFETLADQIRRFVRDPNLCEEFGRRGRARAIEMFAESRMHGGYERLYREMCGV